MPIANRTKKTVFSKEFDVCSSSWSKALGLMFRTKVEKPLVFLFNKERKHALHMLFVFCAIDVLFLDNNKKVVDMKENFRPFTFYTPKRPCSIIIELPNQSIRRSKTKIGDKISF